MAENTAKGEDKAYKTKVTCGRTPLFQQQFLHPHFTPSFPPSLNFRFIVFFFFLSLSRHPCLNPLSRFSHSHSLLSLSLKTHPPVLSSHQHTSRSSSITHTFPLHSTPDIITFDVFVRWTLLNNPDRTLDLHSLNTDTTANSK
jgi:hypothetical protein